MRFTAFGYVLSPGTWQPRIPEERLPQRAAGGVQCSGRAQMGRRKLAALRPHPACLLPCSQGHSLTEGLKQLRASRSNARTRENAIRSEKMRIRPWAGASPGVTVQQPGGVSEHGGGLCDRAAPAGDAGDAKVGVRVPGAALMQPCGFLASIVFLTDVLPLPGRQTWREERQRPAFKQLPKVRVTHDFH